MSESRRLAAILIADVAGFSRLMGEDEAGAASLVRERLEASVEIARARGGRLVKTMGDGLLLEFASVVAAVESAIATQRMMGALNAGRSDGKRILFRIGVNLGDVLVDGDDIIGEGVNVTARLESIAEPGGLCLSGAAYEQVRGRVAFEFADLGEPALKNIARPVRVWGLSPETIASVDAVGPQRGERAEPPPPGRQGPQRLSMVVLPFANLGGGPDVDQFAAAVTESLITDLARFRPSRGHRNGSYANYPADYKQVGRELNVAYVVEGGLQRVGDRMRVSVRFIDAANGALLWGDRFDKTVGDAFQLQDAIVARLASSVVSQFSEAVAQWAERTENVGSEGLVFRAWNIADRAASLSALAEARRLFEQALAIEPDNAWALTGIANIDMNVALSFYPPDRKQRLAAAEANVIKALALTPTNQTAHLVLGVIEIHTHRADQGIRECERALELDRSMINAHGQIGFAKIQLGRAQETEVHVEEALRLGPTDRFAYMWSLFAAIAKLHLGEDEAAVARLRRSLEGNRNNPITHFLLAAALAHLGRVAEAQAAVSVGLALNPNFTIAGVHAGRSTENPTALAGGRRIVEGMRKAGVPEGRTAEAPL